MALALPILDHSLLKHNVTMPQCQTLDAAADLLGELDDALVHLEDGDSVEDLTHWYAVLLLKQEELSDLLDQLKEDLELDEAHCADDELSVTNETQANLERPCGSPNHDDDSHM